MPLQGSQCSLQRMFFRHEMSALALSWEVWATQMFTVLSSLLSWGKEKCHFLWNSYFIPLLLHASSQIHMLFTLWRFLFLAYTKHPRAVTVLLSFRVTSLKRARRKHLICYGYQTADLNLSSSFNPEDIWSFSHFRWWLWVTRSDCLPFILELSYRQHYCWSYAQLRQKTFYSVSVSWDFHIGSLLWHNKLNVNFIKFAVQVFPCRVTGGYFISDLVLTHTTYSLLNVSVLSSSYSLSGGIHDRHSYRLETLYIRNPIQIWFCLAKWQNDFFFFLIAWLSATEGNRSRLLPRGFYPFCSFILYAFFHPFCR